MNRYLISIICFVIIAISASAQTPSRTEIVARIQHALELEEQDKYAEARQLYIEVEPYVEGEDKFNICVKISSTWYNEARIRQLYEDYENALWCYENALPGFRELRATHIEFSILKNIAWINAQVGDLNKATATYRQALELAQQQNNKADCISIAISLYKLCVETGNMEQKSHYDQLIESLFHSTDDLETHYLYYLHGGDKAKQHGKDYLAEQYLLKAIGIAEKQATNGNNSNLTVAYFKLGILLYNTSNRYNEAYEYLQLSLGNGDKINPHDYITYSIIASLCLQMGDMGNCLRYLNILATIEPYIQEPRQLSKIYCLYGDYYRYTNDYSAALKCYSRAEELLAARHSTIDYEWARIYAMMGSISYNLERPNEAKHYYNLYEEAIKNIYGIYSLDYIDAQIYLANMQAFAGHIDEGCKNYTEAVTALRQCIKQRLPYMNTAEREGFWEPLSSLFTTMTPYALAAELYQTEYTKSCYDALLLSKAFLLDSERSIYDIVLHEGDATDMQTYRDISFLKAQINEWSKDYAYNADSIMLATRRIDQLEHSLMDGCESIKTITAFMDITYDSVRQTLGDNEVVIDFTDFVKATGDRHYAAYIVTPNQKYPLLKHLFAESQIDSLGIIRPDLYYDSEFAPTILKLLWEPLGTHIAEGATIYYIPSQMLFQVSLESLPLADGSLLGEHYDFVRISSARELVKRAYEEKKTHSQTAVLYGGLHYDLSSDTMVHNSKQYKLTNFITTRGTNTALGNIPFKMLTGTKEEIDRIAPILQQQNFEVTLYTGSQGTEESFLNLHGKSPQILHLATHGFYYTPAEANEVDYLRGYRDAMSLSGLIMSGGNAAWQGKELPENVMGGVLTASDIARLDLSGTDMVVLSACKTGQGEATPEGLYGLQRAFKKAGAGTIIATLWGISDKTTTEFMTEFYSALAQNGWDKHKAFNQAKKRIRQLHEDPYDWAAFVMMD